MANKRMFSKDVVLPDEFVEMPTSAKLLYYDLGMRADDDGFVGSPRQVMKISRASEDDMKLLISKKFVIPFDSGVIVIINTITIIVIGIILILIWIFIDNRIARAVLAVMGIAIAFLAEARQ